MTWEVMALVMCRPPQVSVACTGVRHTAARPQAGGQTAASRTNRLSGRMFHRPTSFASLQRTSASADATSPAPASRQTPAPSNAFLAPLLDRRTDQLGTDARTAVRGDNANKLQQLLREQPGLLTQPFGDKSETLLTEAARTGKHNAVQAILMQARIAGDGSSFSDVVNHRTVDGRTALTLAVEHGRLDVAKTLVSHDEVARANPEVAMEIKQNHPDAAKLLVKHGPGSTRIASTSAALSDASAAAYLGDANKLQALLRQNPELLTMQFGRRRETLLTEAARAGENSSVQAILMHALLHRPAGFADIVNHRNNHGDTALAQAIQHASLDVATSLLKYEQTSVTLANQHGEAPLHHAASAENPQFAVRLLRHERIRADQTDGDGNTPLHRAIRSDRSETAVAIARHATAAPDHVNDSGQSALAMAIDARDLLVIDTLLKHPLVNPDRTNGQGQTLLWQTLANWQNNMLLGGPETPLPRWSHILGRLAASPRVDSNRRSPEGETPLTFLSKLACPWDIGAHVEFNQWRNRTVQAMLEGSRRDRGRLDPEATNAAGKTPYQVALAANNTSLAQVFEADAQARRASGSPNR